MLGIQVFADSTKDNLLADLTSLVGDGGVTFGTSRHGFAECEIPLIRCTLEQAFQYYAWAGTPHLVLTENGVIVYEGRVERVGVVNGGATITAYGYWRALSDLLYTALWSHSGTADWRELTDEDFATQATEQFLTDNNNRLHISLRKNERYASGIEGGLIYVLPNRGSHNLAEISFDYDFNMSSSWTLRVETYTDDFSASTTEWTLAGTGATQTGTATIALTANRRVIAFEVFNNTGAPINYTGETGAAHAKATNVRVTAEQASPIYASDIVAETVADIAAVNPTQLSATARITATTTDIFEAVYEDVRPADVIDELAELEGLTAAVWENQQLFFGDPADIGREYFVDITGLEMIRDLAELENRIYGLYRDENGRMLRTATTSDTESQTRYGLIRDGVVRSSGTSATTAEAWRDAALADRADYALQAAIRFNEVFNAGGGRVPLSHVRAGDTITIRNLSPALGTAVDNIRTFTIARTRYNATVNGRPVLDVEPKAPTPTIPNLIAG